MFSLSSGFILIARSSTVSGAERLMSLLEKQTVVAVTQYFLRKSSPVFGQTPPSFKVSL